MRPTDERGRPIGASPGALPEGEATRAAGGLRGGRAAYTVHPTAAQTGILFSRSSRSLLQRFPLCTVVYLRLKLSFTGFSFGKLREKRLTV